jgi:hypothetical protein
VPGAAGQLTRRRAAPLLLAAAVAACGAPPRPAPAGETLAGTVPRCSAEPAPGAERVLPAGLYFRSGSYVSGRCPDCPRPTHAALVGVHALPGDAERAARAVPPEALPPGYPWAVHTDDLGLADDRRRGLAVVAGLFASLADADAWLAAASCLRGLVRLAPLLEAAPEEGPADPPARRVAVVQVGPAGPVPAYAPADLDRLEEAVPDTGGDADELRRVAARRLAPVCHVPGGALFTFFHGEHGYADEVYRYRRQWAPVRCAGRLAYVPWTATLLESLVTREPDGSYRLHQVISVECDRATWDEWPYDARGRRGRGRAFAARGGCR